MEKETHLTPQQSLDLITDVINQTRENIKSYSFVFLLWGWTLVIASILRFILQTQTSFRLYFIPFPILAGVAVLTTIFYHRRKTTETYLGNFLRKLWIVLALGFVSAVFVSVYQRIEPITFTLILAAIGTCVSGLILKFRPLVIGSVCFFGAAIACVFVSSEYKVLINGVAIIAGYLIPGYMLKSSKD